MNILEACRHPSLFERWFKDPATYERWFVFLAALFALPMTEEQLAIYKRHTGRSEPPAEPAREGWLICGRRGGKSFTMALVAVYLACFREYRQHLAPGERATVMVIAADRRQARVIMRYIRALLTEVPTLAELIENETAEAFDLTNRVTIEVGTASFRSTRGYSYAAVLADELSSWRTDDAAEPDFEILNAIRPGMATIPNSLLLCGSSPRARRGALFDAYERHWGRDGAPLVWKATTREMNPVVPQSVVDEALARDHADASAEYLAEWRNDLERFVPREVIEACISAGVYERPRIQGVRHWAFVDPSGGSSDSMTLAIGHRDGNNAVLDAIRERRPPFSPESVVAEFAETLRSYGISEVAGDRYAGQWPREQFRKHGISYQLSEKPASELYLDLLPVLNSGRAQLLDNDKLKNQLVSLERRTTRGSRDKVDHPPGGHDDVAVACAGLVSLLLRPTVEPPTAAVGTYSRVTSDDPWSAARASGLVGQCSYGPVESDSGEMHGIEDAEQIG